MTTKTRILLGISLTSFAISLTGVLWGIFAPVGAITFGLFMVFNLLGRETALFEAEQRMRASLAEENSPSRAVSPRAARGVPALSAAPSR
jgi:hypothetical protein